jgi:hypothetical protein
MAKDVESAVGQMASRKKPNKILDHIRIMPAMGGGVSVEHHYRGGMHEPKVHNFGMTDGSGFQKHLQTFTGMPMGSSGETETTQPNDEE